MLVRELKSKIKKEGTIAYFIVAQTFKGNSYTCQISNEGDIKRFKKRAKELLPFMLADNLLPEYPFEQETIISAFKFNEKAGEAGELVKLAQPFLSFHVDDEDIKGKTVQNRIPIKCINRDVENYPDRVKRLVNNFQEFLGEIATFSFESEYHQGDLFETTSSEVSNNFLDDPFQDLQHATDEVISSLNIQEKHLKGMKAAADEHLKERKNGTDKIGVPMEIREEEL